jgi:ABC-2 type transport system ATP-binding protein
MSITAKSITKLYGKQKALDDVSFDIRSGEVVGFLGPNGAGKSTMMKIITGFLPQTSGQVLVNEYDVIENSVEVRRLIGYLPENTPLYPEMYVREYLKFVASIYKIGKKSSARIREIIGLTGLEPEQHKKIGALSKGYRQRVGLAQALIHDPEVLVLDEPTSGLDPNQIIEIRNLISEAGREKTVMLSTHIMQEAEAICDRIIIINKGKIVADDQKEKIYSSLSGSVRTIQVEFNEAPDEHALESIAGVNRIAFVKDHIWLVQSGAGLDIRKAIFDFAVRHNLTVLSMQKQEKKLEQLFQELTKN